MVTTKKQYGFDVADLADFHGDWEHRMSTKDGYRVEEIVKRLLPAWMGNDASASKYQLQRINWLSLYKK